MRIMQIHNFYQQRGGEDAVLEAEFALLTKAGHEVEQYTVYNSTISFIKNKIKSAIEVKWSPKSFEAVCRVLSIIRPDIVHVHNFFPLITPAVFEACTRMQVPVVATLHNYRVTCAGATLMRSGKICERCLKGSPYWGAIHRCYRDSLIGSFATAHMIHYHRRAKTWHKHVSHFIALTEFQKYKLSQAGLPAEKIVVKPNFLAETPELIRGGRREGALFVGRLSPEKGGDVLIEAWREIEYPLTVIGDGPSADSLRRKAPEHVTFLGSQPKTAVMSAMQRASFLVMPSLWYEGLPMTLVEAYANDLPVVASRIGALAELIEEGVTGLGFTTGDPVDLARTVRTILEKPIPQGQCRSRYLERYTASVNLLELERIYANAIDAHRYSVRASFTDASGSGLAF